MASLIESLFGTIQSLTDNFDDKKIQEFTGERVDSVDQFMERTTHKGAKNYGRGFLAGVIGGIVGVVVKMIVDKEVAPNTVQAEDKMTADAVQGIEAAAGKDIWTDDQEKIVGTILEFGMGAVIGGVYGLIVEAIPEAEKISNQQLMSTTKQLALPALGLIPAAGADVANNKVQNLAGHAAFIGTVEVVRRSVRLGLEEGKL